jgi:hypothetical protein
MAHGGSIKNERDDMRRDWRVSARVRAHEMIVFHSTEPIPTDIANGVCGAF